MATSSDQPPIAIKVHSLASIENATLSIASGEIALPARFTVQFDVGFFQLAALGVYKHSLVVMMETMGLRLEHFKKVWVRFSPNNVARTYLLPVAALAAFVKNVKTLQYMWVTRSCFAGTKADFEMLKEALRNHPSLEGFGLGTYGFHKEGSDWPDDNTGMSWLDGTLDALGSCPRMKCIWMGNMKVGHINPSTLTTVGNCRNLYWLDLTACAVSNASLSSLERALGSPHNLTRISLRVGGLDGLDELDISGCASLNNILTSSSGPFRRVIIWVDVLPESTKGELLGLLVTAMAASNCSEGASLMCESDDLSIARASIVNTLRSNYHVTKFDLALCHVTTFAPDLAVTSGNELEEVQDGEISFLLKSNSLGRGSLFQPSPGNESAIGAIWMSLFGATSSTCNKQHLSNIYYLVQSLPLEVVSMLSANLPAEMEE